MWIFLTILCSLFLSLHFFRMGLLLFTLISLSLVPLLFVRKKWSYLIINIIIFLGTLDWIRTLFRIMGERIKEGRPWFIAFIILSIVILINLITLLTFRKKSVKEKFGIAKIQ